MKECLGQALFLDGLNGSNSDKLNCHQEPRKDPCVPGLQFPTMNIYHGYDPCHHECKKCHHECEKPHHDCEKPHDDCGCHHKCDK